MSACEKYRGLLMGLLDKELTPEEANEVNSHLTRCSKCREEYDQLRETAKKIGTLSFNEPQDEILENLWKSPYSRFSKVSGLLLIFFGWITLIVFSLYEIFAHGEEPLVPKIAIVAMILGFLVLLIYVIRERIINYKSDPYKEVVR